jgi:hypothetical protein
MLNLRKIQDHTLILTITLKTYRRGHIYKSSKKTVTFNTENANLGTMYSETSNEQIGYTNSFVEVHMTTIYLFS